MTERHRRALRRAPAARRPAWMTRPTAAAGAPRPLARGHRLIPSRFPSVGILDRVACTRISTRWSRSKGWTNDRLAVEAGRLHLMPRDEWVDRRADGDAWSWRPSVTRARAAAASTAPHAARGTRRAIARHRDCRDRVHRTRELEEVGVPRRARRDARVPRRLRRVVPRRAPRAGTAAASRSGRLHRVAGAGGAAARAPDRLASSIAACGTRAASAWRAFGRASSGASASARTSSIAGKGTPEPSVRRLERRT